MTIAKSGNSKATAVYEPAEIGRLLRQRRKKLGYTQAEVATFNQCSPRFIGELEKGKPGAGLAQTLRIANSLGLDFLVAERGDGSW